MHEPNSTDDVQIKIKNELAKLDQERVELDGLTLVPSQCYYVELNPFHVLFNTNCPDSIKERVNGILSEYLPATQEHKTGDK